MTGFEPATFGATSRRSNRLSYTLHDFRASMVSQVDLEGKEICKQNPMQERDDGAEKVPVCVNPASSFG